MAFSRGRRSVPSRRVDQRAARFDLGRAPAPDGQVTLLERRRPGLPGRVCLANGRSAVNPEGFFDPCKRGSSTPSFFGPCETDSSNTSNRSFGIPGGVRAWLSQCQLASSGCSRHVGFCSQPQFLDARCRGSDRTLNPKVAGSISARPIKSTNADVESRLRATTGEDLETRTLAAARRQPPLRPLARPHWRPGAFSSCGARGPDADQGWRADNCSLGTIYPTERRA